MNSKQKCQDCGADYGEDHSEPGCPNCGSFEYLDVIDTSHCPACGVDIWEWYRTHPARTAPATPNGEPDHGQPSGAADFEQQPASHP